MGSHCTGNPLAPHIPLDIGPHRLFLSSKLSLFRNILHRCISAQVKLNKEEKETESGPNESEISLPVTEGLTWSNSMSNVAMACYDECPTAF